MWDTKQSTISSLTHKDVIKFKKSRCFESCKTLAYLEPSTKSDNFFGDFIAISANKQTNKQLLYILLYSPDSSLYHTY